MTQPRTILLTAALALVAAMGTSGCFNQDAPASSGGGGGARPTSGGGGNSAGSASASPKTTTKQTTDGSVTARINGSDRISCTSINSEISVTAQGRSQWTAVAKRTYVQGDPAIPNGVTVSPTSGELDSGKSTTIRVQGSYDGPSKVFYVFVTAPNRAGSGGTVLEYKCR